MQSAKVNEETVKASAFDWKSLLSAKGASAATAAAVLVAGAVTFGVSSSIAESQKVISGVQADGASISGLNEEGTRRAFEGIASSKIHTINFTYGDKTFSIQPSDINWTPNVDEATKNALSYGRSSNSSIDNLKDQIQTALNGREVNLTANYDENLLNEKLNAIAADINCQPINAYCDLDNSGNVVKYAGVVGKHLDTEAIAQSLKDPLNSLNVQDNIELTPEETQPFVTTEDIEQIDSVLGQYTTSFYLGDRGDNISLAASSINDTLLKPGWTFSFNDVVGERSYSNGYKTAGVILNGRPAQGVGGGICQVSSTLYNAVLLAGLTPTERTPHYFPSSYIASGRDATVAYGQIDLKFRNDLPHNVYVLAYTYGPRITCYILGTKADLDGNTIRIETAGSHMNPSVYRVYYKDGQVTKDEFLHTDSYH